VFKRCLVRISAGPPVIEEDFFVVFLSPSRKTPKYYLKLAHDRFFLYALYVISHFYLTIWSGRARIAEFSLLGYKAVQYSESQKGFRRKLSPRSSGYEKNPSMKEAAGRALLNPSLNLAVRTSISAADIVVKYKILHILFGQCTYLELMF
jgi:hypothetical protein